MPRMRVAQRPRAWVTGLLKPGGYVGRIEVEALTVDTYDILHGIVAVGALALAAFFIAWIII